MNISAGSRLGPYEILGRLGAGGMGEVFRARDTRLEREVAVKALAGDFGLDPSRLARFESEARTASALNHPGIVTIHEIGRTDSTPYLVMELIDGKTLREVLYSGALPLRRVVQLAAQLADALARAHEAGIVHRDLKPENVMITRDGFAKILDFGLARIDRRENGNGTGRRDGTVTEETREGAIVGTAGYMSPEQASGQPVDYRSDQFSLGAILYEMLTGRRAFRKPTRAETLAAIIRLEPEPLATLAPRTPPPLRWIVERCLAKLPEERYESTRDFARDMQSLREHFSELDSTAEGAPLTISGVPRPSRLRLSSAMALAVATLVASAYFLGTSGSRTAPSFHRLTFREGTVWSARFAPDGQTVVYGAAWNGEPIRVYATRAESPESVLLPLPPSSPLALSPSGELAISLSARPNGPFSTAGTLARAPLTGGGVRAMLEDVQAADFSPDGASLAALRTVSGRSRLEYPIGRTLYETAAGYLSDPRVSPRGDHVAFLEHPVRGDDAGSIAVVDLEGRKGTLSEGWNSVRGLAWGPDGGEVWFTGASTGSSRALHAVSLAGRRRLIARVPGSLTLHDVSREGRVLLARDHAREGIAGSLPGDAHERDLSWHDWSRPIDLAADGREILFDEVGEGGGASSAVYVRSADDAPALRLGDGRALALSPDGKWALATSPAVPAQLILLPTGAGQQRVIPTGDLSSILKAGWLPDGGGLLLCASKPGRSHRLFVVPLDGGEPRPISPEGTGPEFAVSPDGLRVAAGGPERAIVLYSVAGGGSAAVRGSVEGDVPIRFAPDGRSLYLLVREDGPVARVERLDFSSGNRQPWRELSPADPVGVYGIPRVLLSADGGSYVYAYVRLLDELYLVDGLR